MKSVAYSQLLRKNRYRQTLRTPPYPCSNLSTGRMIIALPQKRCLPAQTFPPTPPHALFRLPAYTSTATTISVLILTKAAPRLGEGPVADAWFEAYGEISSDYDRRVAIETAAAIAGDDEALITRLRAAAAEISSDYDRERALEALK